MTRGAWPWCWLLESPRSPRSTIRRPGYSSALEHSTNSTNKSNSKQLQTGAARGGGSNAQIARKSADLPGFPGGSAEIYRRQCPKTGRCRPESERCRPVSERCRPVSSCGNEALLGLGGFQWPDRGGGRWLVLAVQSTWPSRPVERGSVLPASGISFFCSPPGG